jgi:hypothetical protein
MTAILTETRTVSFPGFKRAWAITKASDMVTCDGQTFVRLCPRSYTLRQLVLEQNTNVPSQPPSNLTSSCGLESLSKLRNEAQALVLHPGEPSAAELLFNVPAGSAKRARTSRVAIRQARQSFSSLEIEIVVDGKEHIVPMLRPVHPRDNVFVLFSPEVITAVIMYIRQEGFADSTSLCYKRHPERPQGIHYMRNDKTYVVVFRKDDGTKGYHRCASIDDALAWQTANIQCCTADGPGDALHDDVDSAEFCDGSSSKAEPDESADPDGSEEACEEDSNEQPSA